LAGLVGAGRSEISQAVFGLDPKATGRIFIDGRPVHIGSPRQAMALGVGFLPEDRKTQGLVLSMGGRANLSLPILNRLSIAGFVRSGREKALTRRYFDRLRLSGGNQQTVVFSRALASKSDVLILNHPTRGVDVGAREEIYDIIRDLVADGKSVILLGDTLDECIGMSTRVIVLKDGLMTGEFEAGVENKPSQVDVVSLMM